MTNTLEIRNPSKHRHGPAGLLHCSIAAVPTHGRGNGLEAQSRDQKNLGGLVSSVALCREKKQVIYSVYIYIHIQDIQHMINSISVQLMHYITSH